MLPSRLTFIALLLSLLASTASVAGKTDEITIGESFTLHSERLDETRRINVFTPTVFGEPVETPLPVLYMLDGAVDEDFLHIAGLAQVFVSNGSVRPFLLVGIENTERRRDMTGPSEDPEDRAIADEIGGAAAFRAFIRDELFPEIERRYEVTHERAVIGEALAGLFVVETLVHAPSMFETYIAVDPSVWWNRYALNESIAEVLRQGAYDGRRLFVAASREASSAERFQRFIAGVENPSTTLESIYAPMPEESHATLFHPAAMRALRMLFPAEAGESAESR